jgi:hypothetical protein
MTARVPGSTARAGWRAAIAVAVLATAGCGSTPETPNPQATQAAVPSSNETAPLPSLPESAPAPEPGLTGLPTGLREMAAELQADDAPAVSAVSVERLMAVLPELPGWTRSRHRGERRQTPASHSMASARYERDAARIDIEVVDTTLDQRLLAPYTMFVNPGFEERTGSDVRRAITLRDSPGFEAWSAATRRAEVVVVIHSRFLVKGTSRTISHLESIRQFIARMRLDTLERLR